MTYREMKYFATKSESELESGSGVHVLCFCATPFSVVDWIRYNNITLLVL